MGIMGVAFPHNSHNSHPANGFHYLYLRFACYRYAPLGSVGSRLWCEMICVSILWLFPVVVGGA